MKKLTGQERMIQAGVKPEMLALYDYWLTDANNDRVFELEGEGMDTSDAQGCADAEFLSKWRLKNRIPFGMPGYAEQQGSSFSYMGSV